MVVDNKISVGEIWQILEKITDPEIPILSIVDLGIVRDVKISPSLLVEKGQGVEVFITSTYSGCPAMDMISMNIKMELLQHGFTNIKITQQLSPAWTTDWMTERGKEKLQQYGIAPPVGKVMDQQFLDDLKVECPQCHSKNTKLLSEFGSTACKALFQCQDCKEPFDYFKCH
ncbi:MAG: phenylacetate-CoA oxygenase, PaaJ subunit [Chitinophagaceae bacterium]|nr:phenylacetate-CoA oxygenase, PaaJ subunit [Chitinophagaceae bacterium]